MGVGYPENILGTLKRELSSGQSSTSLKAKQKRANYQMKIELFPPPYCSYAVGVTVFLPKLTIHFILFLWRITNAVHFCEVLYMLLQ